MTGYTKLDEKLEKIKLENLPEVDTELLRKAIAKTALLDLCSALFIKDPSKWDRRLNRFPKEEERKIIKFILSPYGQWICEGTILENASEKKIKYIAAERGFKSYGKNIIKGKKYVSEEEAKEIVKKLKKEYLEESESKRKKYDPHELEKKFKNEKGKGKE